MNMFVTIEPVMNKVSTFTRKFSVSPKIRRLDNYFYNSEVSLTFLKLEIHNSIELSISLFTHKAIYIGNSSLLGKGLKYDNTRSSDTSSTRDGSHFGLLSLSISKARTPAIWKKKTLRIKIKMIYIAIGDDLMFHLLWSHSLRSNVKLIDIPIVNTPPVKG